MKKEMENVTILKKTVRPDKTQMLKQVQGDSLIKNDEVEKTVRLEKDKILKQVQDDMVVRDDMVRVQGDMEVYGHCERMRSNPANYFARSADKNFSLFTSHLSRRAAFTLAEVLITLGIIGVVAAVTIPVMIANHKKQTLKTQLLKTYSELGQVGQLALADGVIISDVSTPWTRLKTIMKYFKGSKMIVTDADYKNMSATIEKIYPNTNGLKNIDGGQVPAYCDNGGVWQDNTGRYFMANDSGKTVCIDINGVKPPNKYGYDYFVFCYKENNRLVAEGTPDDICTNASALGTVTYTYNAIIDQSPDDEKKSYWKNYLK